MNPTGGVDDFRERLAGVLATIDEVEAAFLFGSHAEDRAGAQSDIDLGIILTSLPDTVESTEHASNMRPDRDPDVRLQMLAAFVREGFDHVDLVFLTPDDVVTRFEAVRLNQLVFARSTFDLGSYYSRALREYFDLLPLLAWQREALKRRLREVAT